MLKKILSISGRPGLFKLVSQGKNMYIVESITDGKRIPTYPRDKVVSLGDIAIYTSDEEVPLSEVLNTVKEKENGGKCVLSNTQPDTLKKYFSEILPDFDRERVYPSDIKKLISWYNMLIEADMSDFKAVEKEETEEKEEKPAEEKEVKAEKAEEKPAARKTAKKEPKKASDTEEKPKAKKTKKD